MLAAENPSRNLRKVSEIYDRIAFAGVGSTTSTTSCASLASATRTPRAYTYSRDDVDAQALANQYAQMLGQIFTHEMKPLEVEILVTAVGFERRGDRLFHIRYDGSVTDEDGFVALGGDADAIRERLSVADLSGMDLAGALKAAVDALAGPDRTLTPEELEVGVLDRHEGPLFPSARKGAWWAALSLLSDARLPLTRWSVASPYLWDRNRIRRDLHLTRPAAAQPGRGCPLPVPQGRELGSVVKRVSGQRRSSVSRRWLPPRVRHAECDSVGDVVVHDKAGERILDSCSTRPRNGCGTRASAATIYLFKNNTDSAGNSYGCHENYLTSRQRRLLALHRGPHSRSW